VVDWLCPPKGGDDRHAGTADNRTAEFSQEISREHGTGMGGTAHPTATMGCPGGSEQALQPDALGISLVSRPKRYKVGSLRVDMGNLGSLSG